MSQEPVVFISHSHSDSGAASVVCRTLEHNGIRCWISSRDIPGGDLWDEPLIKAIDNSRIVILIYSLRADKSDAVKKELHRAFDKKKVIIPFCIEEGITDGGLEFLLLGIQRLNAVEPPLERHLGALVERVAAILERNGNDPAHPNPIQSKPPALPPPLAVQPLPPRPLVRTAKKSLRVALLYKRSAQPDDQVLAMLEAGLRSAGHEVFVDRHLRIGVEWAAEIDRQVREADAIIPLISAASLQSEMLSMELQTAADAALKQLGRPRILPVRVNFEGELEEPFRSILDRLQYATWRNSSNDAQLLKELLDGLENKQQQKVVKDEPPGGAIPPDSPYYVVQNADQEFHDALLRQDSIVLVKGARQMGKTSLLARGLREARRAQKTVLLIDFQKLNQTNLTDIDSLYRGLASMICSVLKIPKVTEDDWRAGGAPSVNFESFIRGVMDTTDGHVILAMDEVDRLFSCPYASEVFGLFRSWHNERAIDPTGPWERITLAIVYATEAHLFITDQNQSPFNVGTRLELHDFGLEQVRTLNDLFGSPINTPEDLHRFYKLFNGQPYLTRRGFYDLTHYGKCMDELVAVADTDEGPYGDHLRRILVMLARDKELLAVVRGMLNGERIPDPTSFYRLRSGGLIVGGSAHDARFRCGIYESYLARHLS